MGAGFEAPGDGCDGKGREEALADEYRRLREPEDSWTDTVLKFVKADEKKGKAVFVPDIMADALELDANQQHIGNMKRIASILRKAGWTHGDRIKGRNKHRDRRPWLPPTENDEDQSEMDLGAE